jgi:hypothetical protein
MAKPTKPTVPDAPLRTQPSTFSARAETFLGFWPEFATYMDETADFTDEQATAALAAALGGDLPALTGKALQYLRVNAGETAAEFADPLAGFVIDEDDFSTDSATRPPSQQSTKAYVDEQVGAIPAVGYVPYDIETSGDGLFYDHSVDGNTSAIVTPTFESGYEYMVIVDGLRLSDSSLDRDVRLEQYRVSAAAYTTPQVMGAVGDGIGEIFCATIIVSAPDLARACHLTQVMRLSDGTSTSMVAVGSANAADTIDKLRITPELHSFDAGKAWLFKRAITY